MPTENTKRILKNTLMLYVRMIIVMAIALYTSRLVVSALGKSDYGTYTIVGSLVTMFVFMNTTMAGATARFLSFEIGKGDQIQIQKVFSAALLIHLAVAAVVFVLAESVVWFIMVNLNIPDDRLFAAHVTYQISLATCLLSILRIPYESAVIAHEKMEFFAYAGIVEGALKLTLVIIMIHSPFDKLIAYATLCLIITLIVNIMFYFYNRSKFKSCRLTWHIDAKTFKPILAFSSWDLYGNLAVMGKTQGMNILINLFFGVTLNAAQGVAAQVEGAISGFAAKFLTAVQPQIVKNYAQKNIADMLKLMSISAKYAYLGMLFLSLPLLLEMPFILNLWLGAEWVPAYAPELCRLVLIQNLIMIMFKPITFAIHATGKIKRLSFINGTLYLLVVPLTWAGFKIGTPAGWAYVANIILLFIGQIINLYTLRLYVDFPIADFVKQVPLRCLLTTAAAIIIPAATMFAIPEGALRFLSVGTACAISVPLFTYFIALEENVKNSLKIKIRFIIKKYF